MNKAPTSERSRNVESQYVPMKLRLQLSAWVVAAAAIAFFVWLQKSGGHFTLGSAKALVLLPLCVVVLGMLWVPWLYRLIFRRR